jgi:hypothetical protein
MNQKFFFTFRVWWNAHQHHTQSPLFHAVIVRGAKIRAQRRAPSHAHRQTCWLSGHRCPCYLVQGDALGTTSGGIPDRVPESWTMSVPRPRRSQNRLQCQIYKSGKTTARGARPQAEAPSKTCEILTGRKTDERKEPGVKLDHTTIAVVTEEHLFALIILMTHFARELRQENA